MKNLKDCDQQIIRNYFQQILLFINQLYLPLDTYKKGEELAAHSRLRCSCRHL